MAKQVAPGSRGPVSKYDSEKHPRIAASMAKLGATRADIADAFGVSTRTILLWCLYTLGLYTL
jgi:hypothetical protein